MSKIPKTCFLFTQNYPYGKGEVFVEQEISYLSENYSNIVIFPLKCDGEIERPLPENVSVENLLDKKLNISKFSAFQLNLFCVKIVLGEMKFQFWNIIKDLRWNLSICKQQVKRALALNDYVERECKNNCVFYSYWFDSWALTLSLCRVISPKNSIRFYSRAHAFEIYKEQYRKGYHPFKNFMFKHVESVYSVSKMGMNYLLQNYPNHNKKIKYAYLGTKSRGSNPFIEDNVFHIVSCAFVREIKRLKLVPPVLDYLSKFCKVKWTLIGDGSSLNEVKKIASGLNNNVECVFTGDLPQSEIFNFYSSANINLFLSVSAMEGIPFTMIEAISFGIPLMSTDVGGCSEICNDNTGILIKKDFDPEQVANEILEFKTSAKNSPLFRTKVRNYWDDNFNAEKNYRSFYNEISNGLV